MSKVDGGGNAIQVRVMQKARRLAIVYSLNGFVDRDDNVEPRNSLYGLISCIELLNDDMDMRSSSTNTEQHRRLSEGHSNNYLHQEHRSQTQ